MFAYNLQVICVCSFVSCDQQIDLKEMADNSSHCDRPDCFVRQGQRQRKSQRWGGPTSRKKIEAACPSYRKLDGNTVYTTTNWEL